MVGIVGAGVQARTQLMALDSVRGIELVRVTDVSQEARETYARDMGQLLQLDVRAVDTIREATLDSDIVVTATPATSPIVKRGDISKGTHINAIGADAPGKQELEPELLRGAKIVVEDYEQSLMSVRQGLLTEADIHAELGDLLLGLKQGGSRQTR